MRVVCRFFRHSINQKRSSSLGVRELGKQAISVRTAIMEKHGEVFPKVCFVDASVYRSCSNTVHGVFGGFMYIPVRISHAS